MLSCLEYREKINVKNVEFKKTKKWKNNDLIKLLGLQW